MTFWVSALGAGGAGDGSSARASRAAPASSAPASANGTASRPRVISRLRRGRALYSPWADLSADAACREGGRSAASVRRRLLAREGRGPAQLEELGGVHAPEQLHQRRHQAGLARLVARSDAGPVVAVEVL